jgi:hypothetical protein
MILFRLTSSIRKGMDPRFPNICIYMVSRIIPLWTEIFSIFRRYDLLSASNRKG